MSLEKARLLLHSEKSLLHPFVIIFGDESPMKIYGDIPTMNTRTDIAFPPASYHILRFTDGQNIKAFLYVWYYLNNLDEPTSLIDMLEFERYDIPVPRSPSLSSPSLIIPTSIEAYYFLKAFSIPFSDQIWGKWFLGIFPLDPSKDEMNREILRDVIPHLPQHFILPPYIPVNPEIPDTIWSNHIDDDITRLFPDAIPPSFAPCLGRQVTREELRQKYILSRSKRELAGIASRGNNGKHQLLTEPLLCITNREYMWNVVGYEILAPKVGEADEVQNYALLLIISPSCDSKLFGNVLVSPDSWDVQWPFEKWERGVPFVTIWTTTRVNWLDSDMIDRRLFVPTTQQYEPVFFRSQAVSFSLGKQKGKYKGNPVVMASRSNLILELMERGIEGEILLGESLPFVTSLHHLWKWLNNDPINITEFREAFNLKEVWNWLSYLSIPFNSPLFHLLRPDTRNKMWEEWIIPAQLKDDKYLKIRYYVPLIPPSREKYNEVSLDLCFPPDQKIDNLSIWHPPYRRAQLIEYDNVKEGDLALIRDKLHRVGDKDDYVIRFPHSNANDMSVIAKDIFRDITTVTYASQDREEIVDGIRFYRLK